MLQLVSVSGCFTPSTSRRPSNDSRKRGSACLETRASQKYLCTLPHYSCCYATADGQALSSRPLAFHSSRHLFFSFSFGLYVFFGVPSGFMCGSAIYRRRKTILESTRWSIGSSKQRLHCATATNLTCGTGRAKGSLRSGVITLAGDPVITLTSLYWPRR